MDTLRFSALAHRTHRFCSPIAESRLDALLTAAGIGRGQRVVDFGCGNGGMAAWIASRFGVQVDAVERSAPMAALARTRARDVPPPGSVTVHESPAAAFAGEPVYHLAVAVGVDALFRGATSDTLAGLARVLRPGGHILFGDTCWRRRPAPEYLAALGASEDAMGRFEDIEAAGRAAGLTTVAAQQASVAEWDDYETRYADAIDSHLRANPDDPEATAFAERIREHRRIYLNHGRDNLGFAIYLFTPAPHQRIGEPT